MNKKIDLLTIIIILVLVIFVIASILILSNFFTKKYLRPSINNGKSVFLLISSSGNIYGVNQNMKIEKQLVKGMEGTIRFQDIAKDNKKILFTFRPSGSGYERLYIVNFDGSGMKELSKGLTGWIKTPRFSPDNKKVVFWHKPQDSEDGYLYTDGSYMKNLTQNLKGSMVWEPPVPQFSPDSEKIMFIIKNPSTLKEDLYIINTDGAWFIKLNNLFDTKIDDITWIPNP